MPLSKPISMEEYLEREMENLVKGVMETPRPVAQPATSYVTPLRTLFDAADDEMNDEERRFFERRYKTFVDNANNYIANECQSQEDINQIFIRRLARQDAAIDRLERKFTKSIAQAVEDEIDIFLGSKPTVDRIRGINRRLNTMQLELKTFKDEVKSHPEFSGTPEDVRAKKAAMAAAAGVANQSKKRKKIAGTAVPVGAGAGQGPDGIDVLYETMLNMASQIRNLRAQPTTSDAEQTIKEEDLRMRMDGAGDGPTDAEMADDEASQNAQPAAGQQPVQHTGCQPPSSSANGGHKANTPMTNLADQLSSAGLNENRPAMIMPIRTVGWHGYPAADVE
ncbi:hypothetical protein B0T21DRAFT_417202 [Apiosordaria backusii]|uniref:Uncharacterized protein n=1 Tax=Apiosordaria backusii TaxID=314023 RepID=A0AA39ZPV5_9PEZI|nr:hypothetical protein B0T21DRAFT_417202 [Apiosordaria backusii]